MGFNILRQHEKKDEINSVNIFCACNTTWKEVIYHKRTWMYPTTGLSQRANFFILFCKKDSGA